MHLPMKVAASELGTSDSNLKKICRAHNIHAWPARQIQAKLKVRNSLEKTLLMASNTAQEEKVREKIQDVDYDIACIKTSLSPNVSGKAKRMVCRVRPSFDKDGRILIPDESSYYYLGETTVDQHAEKIRGGGGKSVLHYEPETVRLPPLNKEKLSDKHHTVRLVDVNISDDYDITLVPSLPTLLMPLKDRSGIPLKPPAAPPQGNSKHPAHGTRNLLGGDSEVARGARGGGDDGVEGDHLCDKENVGAQRQRETAAEDNTTVPRVYGFKHYVADTADNAPEGFPRISNFDYERYFCLDSTDYPQYQSSVIQSFFHCSDSVAMTVDEGCTVPDDDEEKVVQEALAAVVSTDEEFDNANAGSSPLISSDSAEEKESKQEGICQSDQSEEKPLCRNPSSSSLHESN